jgi:hypothetical protein
MNELSLKYGCQRNWILLVQCSNYQYSLKLEEQLYQ